MFLFRQSYFINKEQTMDMINQQRVFEMLPISKEQRLKLIEALELVKDQHEANGPDSERKETCSDDTSSCSLSPADQVDSRS